MISKNIIFFICMVFMFSNLNALNLTNNTSWLSVNEIEDEENPTQILGEVHILLDINDEMLSLVIKSFDTNNDLTDINIVTESIYTYKHVKDSYLINSDIRFYYESNKKLLLMNNENLEIVFEQVD